MRDTNQMIAVLRAIAETKNGDCHAWHHLEGDAQKIAGWLAEEKLVREIHRGQGRYITTSRGEDLVNTLSREAKETRFAHLVEIGATFARAVRQITDESNREALNQAPVELSAFIRAGATIDVSPTPEHNVWLGFAGEKHHDPMLAQAWGIAERTGPDGKTTARRLGDADERDRWQAAAFRSLVRGGTPDAHTHER